MKKLALLALPFVVAIVAMIIVLPNTGQNNQFCFEVTHQQAFFFEPSRLTGNLIIDLDLTKTYQLDEIINNVDVPEYDKGIWYQFTHVIWYEDGEVITFTNYVQERYTQIVQC